MISQFKYLSLSEQEALQKIAESLVADDKGLIAADESEATFGKRLSIIHLENSPEIRRAYRQIVLTTPYEISDYISGIVLHEETIQQSTDSGIPFIHLLNDRNLKIGVKLDKGLVRLAGTENEYTTQGLDHLAERVVKFKNLGCTFCKFRCVYKLGEHTPSLLAINQNALVLGRFAAICQSEGLVPIVEPELLTIGDHDVVRCQKATEHILSAVFKELHDQNVLMEGMLLKTNMITSGYTCANKYTPEDIGKMTVETLTHCVPPAVPGITFLSGGASEEDASVNLCACNKFKLPNCWKLSFSFGRALQTSVLRCWNGNEYNTIAAQHELLKRCKANHLAIKGDYEPGSIPMYQT